MVKSCGILQIFTTWALLECDDEIGKLYRSLYCLDYFYKPRIQKPLWGSHISIIRGETELDQKIAEEIKGRSIEFYYIPKMETNGCHFYLPVICPIFDTIRGEFGLGPSIVNYHLSIGNLRNDAKSNNRTCETFS